MFQTRLICRKRGTKNLYVYYGIELAINFTKPKQNYVTPKHIFSVNVSKLIRLPELPYPTSPHCTKTIHICIGVCADFICL